MKKTIIYYQERFGKGIRFHFFTKVHTCQNLQFDTILQKKLLIFHLFLILLQHNFAKL